MGLLIASLVLVGLALIGVIMGRILYGVYCVDFVPTKVEIQNEIEDVIGERPTEITFGDWFTIKNRQDPNKYQKRKVNDFGYYENKTQAELRKEFSKEFEHDCNVRNKEIAEYNARSDEIREHLEKEKKKSGSKKLRNYILKSVGYSLLSCACLLILLFGKFCKVNANEVGIIYDDRYGVMQNVKYEGFQMKSIFEHVTTISTQNRSAKLTTTGQTSDGQYGTFELSLIYRIDRTDAGKFYKKANASDISMDALNTIVKSCLQSSTIKYDIFELLSTKLEVARIDFREDLADELMDKYFITLVDVSFDDVDAGEKVEEILKAKAESLQRIEIAERQAEADLITAENKAEIERTLADAEAYSITKVGGAKGEAESAYVDKVKAMIDNLETNAGGTLTYKEFTDIVLGIIFYDTWNGELPEVLTSDSLSAMIGGLISNNP